MAAAALTGAATFAPPVLLYASSSAEYFIIKLCISLRLASLSDIGSGGIDGVGVASSSVVVTALLGFLALTVVECTGARSLLGNEISTGHSFARVDPVVEFRLSGASLLPVRCGLEERRGRSSEWLDLWRTRYTESVLR